MRGLSQEELALKANLNTSFVGLVERGVKKPTVETLNKLATALDVSFAELFDFKADEATPPDTTIIDKIIYSIQDCTLEEQEIIHGLLKQIMYLKNKKK